MCQMGKQIQEEILVGALQQLQIKMLIFPDADAQEMMLGVSFCVILSSYLCLLIFEFTQLLYHSCDFYCFQKQITMMLKHVCILYSFVFTGSSLTMSQCKITNNYNTINTNQDLKHKLKTKLLDDTS